MKTNQIKGYPSIDKPWLKYYSDEAINAKLPNCSMYEYVYECNKNHLDDVALIYFNKSITYRTMFNKIDTLAQGFIDLGITDKDTVTLLVLSQPETVFVVYALNKIGANINFVNVLLSENELKEDILNNNSKYIVTLNLFTEKLKSLLDDERVKCVIEFSLADSLNNLYKYFINKEVKVQKFVNHKIIKLQNVYSKYTNTNTSLSMKSYVITHTGGTTGIPKGVLISNKAINGITVEYKYSLKYKRQEKYMDLVVPFVIYGWCVNIHMPLCLGLKTILIPTADLDKIAKQIYKYKPNHLTSIPSYWQPILSSSKKDFSFIVTAGSGGDGMNIELENQLNEFLSNHKSNAVLLNGYGMSELCSTICACQYNAVKSGSVGIPLSHNIVSAFDVETGEELIYGQTGEICVKSPYAMVEYVNNEKETENIMMSYKGENWIRTGDLGHIDSDGFIYIDGRLKRIILTQLDDLGHKVFPSQLENVIGKVDIVQSVCVVPKKHKERKVVPVAYVTLKDKSFSTEKAKEILYNYCKEHISEYAQPYEFIIKKDLPLTSVGKIDFMELEKQANEE